MERKYNKPVVIPPSFEILPDDLGLVERIELAGRVCYKSEDKITPGSSAGFCRNMAKHRHNSVLEMGVRTYVVEIDGMGIFDIFMAEPKFLIIDYLGGKEWLITGSVRAFREMLMKIPESIIFQTIAFDIGEKHPYLFGDISHLVPSARSERLKCQQVSLADIDQLTPELQARHRYVAVKFIVNRAVTHELVRHRPCAFLQESQRYCRYGSGKFGDRVIFIKPVFFKTGSTGYKLWEKSMLEAERTYLELVNEKDENGKQKYTAQACRTVLPNSCKTEIFVYANLAQWHHIFHMRTSPVAEPSMREIMIPLQEEFVKRFPEQNFGKPLRMPEGWV